MSGLIRQLITLFATVLTLVMLAGGYLIYDYSRFLSTPIDMGTEQVLYEVKSGETLNGVIRDWTARQWLDEKQQYYFRALLQLEPPLENLKTGEFMLHGGQTPQALLNELVTAKTRQYALTIPEGLNFKQMLAVIRDNDILEQTLTDADAEKLITELGSEYTHPEGWFLPDTYYFPKGETDRGFLKRAHLLMREALKEAWENRVEGLPFKNPYEVLIMASLVEKETAAPEERPLIAAVFISRLNKGMKLQTDPTVIYGMGERYQGNIRKADLKRDTPYNTYTRQGLTPTPIAMPGVDALQAVTHPAETKALYFVAKGGGKHHFSETYAEHKRAVINYLLGGKASRYKGDS